MPRRFLMMILLLSLAVPAGAAVEAENLGAHRLLAVDDFQQVIETKCTVCHTRERVDIAIKKRHDLEKIEQRMLQRGAVLTERDKKVLGTFWGSPLKEREEAVPASAPTR